MSIIYEMLNFQKTSASFNLKNCKPAERFFPLGEELGALISLPGSAKAGGSGRLMVG